MQFEVMLQSCLNRGDVTGPNDTIPIPGCQFDQDNQRWMFEVDTLERLRQLVGMLTVALRFETDGSPDPHVLIVEDDLELSRGA